MSSFDDLLVTVDRLLARPLVLPGLLLVGVLFGVLAHVVARRRGWRPAPAVLAGLSAALVFAVTLSRRRTDWSSMPGVIVQEEPFCQINGFSAQGSFEVLNILVFVPFVFFAVLATSRPLVVAAVAVAASAGIELVQTTTGQGVCETQDFLNNSVGIVAAAAAGAALVVKLRSARRQSRLTRS